MFPTDVVIVAGVRTPMSRYTGSFSEVSAIDLGRMHQKKRFGGRESIREILITRFLEM
jgi:acetyl-CoA acetyltransferase